MSLLKKMNWGFFCASLVLVVLGVICIVLPGVISAAICYVAGALMMIYGVLKVGGYFASKTHLMDSLIVGVLLALIGFIMIYRHDEVINFIFTFLGILLMLDGVVKLMRAFEARGAKQKDWLAMLICAVIVLGAGVLVIADPFKGSNVAVILLGVSLILDGLQNLYVSIRAAYWLNRTQKEADALKLNDYTVNE